MRAGSEAPDGTAATSTGAAAGSRCDARMNRTPRGTGHSPCSGILASLPSRGIWTRTVRVSAGFSGRFDRTRGGDRTVRHGRSESCVTPPFDPRVASGPRHRGIDRAAGRVQDAPYTPVLPPMFASTPFASTAFGATAVHPQGTRSGTRITTIRPRSAWDEVAPERVPLRRPGIASARLEQPRHDTRPRRRSTSRRSTRSFASHQPNPFQPNPR
jgi:hypothetical protein